MLQNLEKKGYFQGLKNFDRNKILRAQTLQNKLVTFFFSLILQPPFHLKSDDGGLSFALCLCGVLVHAVMQIINKWGYPSSYWVVLALHRGTSHSGRFYSVWVRISQPGSEFEWLDPARCWALSTFTKLNALQVIHLWDILEHYS